MKTVAVLIALSLTNLCSAEIKVYQTTDNTGLNKREQIDTVEKYLTDLSSTLKNMEVKLDQNALKLKTLEDVVKAIKEKDLKKIQEQLGEKTVTAPNNSAQTKTLPLVSAAEIEKINADILSLKNNDIEVVKGDMQALKTSVRYIQTMLKIAPSN